MAKQPSSPRSLDKPRFVPPDTWRDEHETIELTRETISHFLEWAAHVPTGRKDAIREKIARVARDEALVKALGEALMPLDDVDPVRHFLLLSTIGETRNPVALPFLKELVWLDDRREYAPSPRDNPADQSGTNLLLGLQARAVEMISYIGAEGHEMVLDVVARHPSRAVRIAAIDAHLFNHQDSPEAKAALRRIARSGDEKFIGLARFTRDADPEDFNRRIRDYYDKHRDERPPLPKTEGPQKRGHVHERPKRPESKPVT